MCSCAARSTEFGYAVWKRDIARKPCAVSHCRHCAATAGPTEAEIHECQGPMFEWANLRNQSDEYCIKQGAVLKLSSRIVANYTTCRNLLRQRTR